MLKVLREHQQLTLSPGNVDSPLILDVASPHLIPLVADDGNSVPVVGHLDQLIAKKQLKFFAKSEKEKVSSFSMVKSENPVNLETSHAKKKFESI